MADIKVIRFGQKGTKSSRYAISTKLEALDAYANGSTVDVIAAAIGCTESTVEYWINQKYELTNHTDRAFAVAKKSAARKLTRLTAKV